MARRSQARRKKPLGITISEMPIFVFLTKSGQVATLEAGCVQRNTPLSKENICQDQLKCPNHGWYDDADGREGESCSCPTSQLCNS